MRKRIWGKTIGLLFAQYLLLTSIVHANAPEIHIPAQYGTVKEVSPMQATTQESGRMIIHIQDAHCNYEAQKNMAQILDYLVKEHKLKLIMVEGGSGNVGLSSLRAYSDEKARVEVADKYLRAGKISGEEYLDIVSDYNLNLYGVDDQALYDAHLAAFEKIDSIKEEGLKDLEGLDNVITNLKPYIYSEELRQLEKKSSDYAAKTVSLAEYCQYLKEMTHKKGLNLNEFPHLTAFAETARLEKEIDFPQAELQRNAFIKDLANFLDEAQVKELINKSQEFKAKKLTSQEYYSFLQAIGEKKLDLEHNYPQLDAYITYITVSKDINAPDLLKEVSVIEEKIKEACFVNNEQKRLNEISKSLQILNKILNLELTPEEYEYFKANKPKFLTASWIDFLAEGCKNYNLTLRPYPSNVIDGNISQLDGFYKLGFEREKAFISNLVNKMDESGQNLAVLITGGFHTPGVTKMLKDKGYSYMVVAPVITQKSDPNIYFSVLRSRENYSEETSDYEP